MTREITLTEEVFMSLENAFNHFVFALEKFDQEAINRAPSEDSWTAAQVADHIIRSTLSITRALRLPGSIINRNPIGRVPELKKIFLDPNTKFKSPEFILPANGPFEKKMLISRLADAITKLRDAGSSAELLELINHPAFGDITKFEILHFVVYHTQRHTHQLDRIWDQTSL